jgi:hypothetical protein
MRCLRVQLVTGPPGGSREGISRDDNRIVPRGLAEGRCWMPAFVMFAKAPRELKKPRGAPEWRARVRKDTGSALKARMTKTYSPSRRSAPFGETEKENGRRPGASSTGMRSVGSRGLFDIVNRVEAWGGLAPSGA